MLSRISTLGVTLLLFLAGCSAGQITQTADTVAAVPGANQQVGGLAVRNVFVEYPGTEGYLTGGSAPLSIRLFNDSMSPVRLVGVTSSNGPVALGALSLASPAARAGGSINVEIPASGYAVLVRGSGPYLTLSGLERPLKPGDSVTLTFMFSDGSEIAGVAVPVTTPSSPAPRSPMEFDEDVAPHG